jgi:hypothetical protein
MVSAANSMRAFVSLGLPHPVVQYARVRLCFRASIVTRSAMK